MALLPGACLDATMGSDGGVGCGCVTFSVGRACAARPVKSREWSHARSAVLWGPSPYNCSESYLVDHLRTKISVLGAKGEGGRHCNLNLLAVARCKACTCRSKVARQGTATGLQALVLACFAFPELISRLPASLPSPSLAQVRPLPGYVGWHQQVLSP